MVTVLLATDADWIFDEVDAALSGSDTAVLRVRGGRDVLATIGTRQPDLVVLDLQIGSMGGIATCLAIRQEQGMDRLGSLPVLMLLDRQADVWIARTAGSDGWLVKPIDAFRLRRAVEAVLAGRAYYEGVPEGSTNPEPEPAGAV